MALGFQQGNEGSIDRIMTVLILLGGGGMQPQKENEHFK